MRLSLTGADTAALDAALSTLLSPLSYEWTPDWLAASRARVRDLVRADRSVAGMLVENHYHFAPDPEGVAAFEAYRADFQQGDAGFWAAARRLETFHVSDVYDLPSWRKSRAYLEWASPNGYRDGIGLAFAFDEAPPAAIVLYRGQPDSFTTRELGLLRLALPAFKAGVESAQRLASRRHDLTAWLDALPMGLVLFGPDGVTRHVNAAFTLAMASDPEAERLRQAVRQTAHSLARFASPATKSRPRPVVPSARSVITTRAGRYVVQGSYAGEGLIGPGVAICVLVDCLSSRGLDPALLRRHGLTAREIQVARLLDGGARAADIAATLGLSVRTVEHHAAHIYAKLGVHTRAALGAALRSP